MSLQEIVTGNIRYYLKHERRSQVWLAEELSTNVTTVNWWVNGRTIPRLVMIEEIAKLFQVEPWLLLKPSGLEEYFKPKVFIDNGLHSGHNHLEA